MSRPDLSDEHKLVWSSKSTYWDVSPVAQRSTWKANLQGIRGRWRETICLQKADQYQLWAWWSCIYCKTPVGLPRDTSSRPPPKDAQHLCLRIRVQLDNARLERNQRTKPHKIKARQKPSRGRIHKALRKCGSQMLKNFPSSSSIQDRIGQGTILENTDHMSLGISIVYLNQ